MGALLVNASFPGNLNRPGNAHGGQLRQAVRIFGRPLEQWLDLSTGINPQGWQPPTLPADCWNRLPETNDGLEQAAAEYYGCESLLMSAGSQAVIQLLPNLLQPSRVGLFTPSYYEHSKAWQQAGHQLIEHTAEETPDLSQLDVLVVVNPNNPTGRLISREQLLEWHRQLATKGGWLIVDEAFMDTTPGESLLPVCPQNGLIVLRSLGKFFGLAGIRCGSLFAEQEILDSLEQTLGPWALSHPTRWIATQALKDLQWQAQNQQRLLADSERLTELLAKRFAREPQGTSLFQTLQHPAAEAIYQQLAETGILIRLFREQQLVRFGLPGQQADWQRLDQALQQLAI